MDDARCQSPGRRRKPRPASRLAENGHIVEQAASNSARTRPRAGVETRTVRLSVHIFGHAGGGEYISRAKPGGAVRLLRAFLERNARAEYLPSDGEPFADIGILLSCQGLLA